MAEYYLISQLPSLDGLSDNSPLPITVERFKELCSTANKKVLSELDSLTLVPPADAKERTSALINSWNKGEADLRLALCKVRAEKMKKSFDLQNRILSPELLKTATTATEIKNPLEAENFLLQYRLSFLETLRPTDNFSDDFIFYYGLRLMLISRIRQFDTELGETTYKNIYNSIINGDNSEALQ